MKILVFSDFHGDAIAVQKALDIAHGEKPNKVVICGDLFGGWSNSQREIVSLLNNFDCVLYLIKGNNDYPSDIALLPYGMEDNATMYHFGRTLFFTHGDRYNGWNIPPLLNSGDVLVHGHTHVSRFYNVNGLHVINVGSMARPRDEEPAYLVLDDDGATIKDLFGNTLTSRNWQ